MLLLILSGGKEGLRAQNLVPNPGFEQYSQCPSSDNEIQYAISWIDVIATSDYYNCGYDSDEDCPLGYSGSGYAGVSVYRPSWSSPYREYIGAALTNPLLAGQRYYVEFWVRLECHADWASDAMGAWFTYGQPVPPNWVHIFNTTPQVSNATFRMLSVNHEWVKICGSFIAAGGENFITIGSFKDDTHSTFLEVPSTDGNYGVHWSYYLIDDILVEAYDTTTTYACNDTTVYPQPTGNVIIGGVQQEPIDSSLIDPWLNAPPCGLTLPNVLSPNADGLNDSFFVPTDSIGTWSIEIFDRWGRAIYNGHSNWSNGWDTKDNQGNQSTDGTYFYIIRALDQICYEKGFITVFGDR